MATTQPAPEIVEILRDGFTCWNTRDLPKMMEMYAPGAEVDFSELLIDEGVHQGQAAIIRFYDRLWEVWAGVSWQPEEMIAADDDTVVVVARAGTIGRRSGATVGDRFAMVYRLEERRIVRATAYPSRSRAIEALGLQRTTLPLPWS